MKFLLVVFLCFFATVSRATDPVFGNLSESDFKNVISEFSGTWAYSSVSPASGLGHLFGLEFGVVAGVTKTPDIDSLSSAADPSTNIASLPSGGILGVITVPLGLTVEAEVFPKTTVSGVTASSISGAVKWTFSDLLSWPLDVAVKGFATKADLDFSGTVQGVFTTFDLTDNMLGFVVQASKSFLIVEPYITAGIVQAKGDMSYTGTATVFSYTQNSDTQTVSGAMLFAGVNLNLAILKLGAEVGSVFGKTRADAKVSFYF